MSPCGRYRYRLGRRWGEGPTMALVMLNPSTADGEADDPTIRRGIGFARREGCGALEVGNLLAWRATHPRDLPDDPQVAEGPGNRDHLRRLLEETRGPVVVAWGSHPAAGEPARRLLEAYPAAAFLCLGVTASGAPRHPLYVPGAEPLRPYRGA